MLIIAFIGRDKNVFREAYRIGYFISEYSALLNSKSKSLMNVLNRVLIKFNHAKMKITKKESANTCA